jgi:hypothetical protein
LCTALPARLSSAILLLPALHSQGAADQLGCSASNRQPPGTHFERPEDELASTQMLARCSHAAHTSFTAACLTKRRDIALIGAHHMVPSDSTGYTACAGSSMLLAVDVAWHAPRLAVNRNGVIASEPEARGSFQQPDSDAAFGLLHAAGAVQAWARSSVCAHQMSPVQERACRQSLAASATLACVQEDLVGACIQRLQAVQVVERILLTRQRQDWMNAITIDQAGMAAPRLRCIADSVLGNRFNLQHVGTLLSHTPYLGLVEFVHGLICRK